MSDHIPQEVVVEILVRCQVDTVLRCRCVSKQWRSVIDDPDFIKHHTEHSISTNTNYSLYIKVTADLLYKDDLLHESDLEYFQVSWESLDFCSSLPGFDSGLLVGSCNGLLCLRETKPKTAFILNPATQQKLQISCHLFHHYGCLSYENGYGFGYDSITNDYKIVGVFQIFGCDHSKMVIYHVKTREITEVGMPYFIDRQSYCMGMFVGGALHWVGDSLLDNSTRKKKVIVGFDLRTEEIREVPQPEYSTPDCKISISVLGTSLCLCANHTDKLLDFDVWVMKEYGIKESWTKLFSIPYATFMSLDTEESRAMAEFYSFASINFPSFNATEVRPLCFSKNGCQVLLEGYSWFRRLVWYDIEKKRIGKIFKQDCFESTVCFRCLTPLPYSSIDGKQ